MFIFGFPSTYLDNVITILLHITISGDLSVQVNNNYDIEASRVYSILDCRRLKQHVAGLTRKRSNTLHVKRVRFHYRTNPLCI